MPNHSPIVVVEDDDDDQHLIREVFASLQITNELLVFPDTRSAMVYLQSGVQPFVILCDINLPAQNGIEFKRQIDREPSLRGKSIPFIFLTTTAQPSTIATAYHELTVQGFFEKPAEFSKYKELIHHLVAYWRICRHPND